jgi:hypothetical protein
MPSGKTPFQGRRKTLPKTHRRKGSANAKQTRASRQELIWPDNQLTTGDANVQLVLDAFSKVGITFDPSNKIDAQWLTLLGRYSSPAMPDPSPRFRIQDKRSRLSTQRLLSALKEVRSAVLLCEQEAERTDIPVTKQNVALRVKEELDDLQLAWKEPSERVPNYDHSRWIRDFICKIDDLEMSASCAIGVGIHAPHGKSNILVEYTIFVRGLYEFWSAKTSEIGVYKLGGNYTGPFVKVVERCEELLSPDLRPPTENARGKRVARALGVHKNRKAS